MSLFGDSAEDQRDYHVGMAGLLAGVQSLRILAENGLASATDLSVGLAGVREMLDSVPTWRPGEREQLEDMFDKIVRIAAENFGKKND